MGTSHYRYPVKLTSEQRLWLETMERMSRTPAKHYLVARVLLMSDQSQGKSNHTDGQIAEALTISRRTAPRIKQRFVQENLEVALTGSFPRECPERRCLDGKGEAQLIHLACSKAPDGRQRWTLELRASQMVKLEYVEHISPETGSSALKKTRLVPWLKKSWCFPKEADANFVYRMEDVLDVYCQPYDPSLPRICMHENRCESGQRQISPRTRPRRDRSRGKITPMRKRDVPTSSLSMSRGPRKRYLKVTEHRTKKDWALFMQGGSLTSSIPMPKKSSW